MRVRSTESPEEILFLLMPNFSMLGFVSALEPLRVANRFRSESYRWHMVSVDGLPVVASDGIAVMPHASIAKAPAASKVFVVAGFDPLRQHGKEVSAWLRALDRQGITLGAIDTGCFNLAAAGLLRKERITMHWEAIPAFLESHPGLTVTQELFEISERRITCAGGTASIDMMLDLISRAHGSELAMQVSEQFVQGRIRDRSDHQRMAIAIRYGVHNKKVAHVLDAMERNTEEPLSIDALAEEVCVTRRQLERLFQLHLKGTPSSLYLQLRLDQARRLLKQTTLSILEISVTCGFDSASYFSRAYRSRFDVSPSDDRASAPAGRARPKQAADKPRARPG